MAIKTTVATPTYTLLNKFTNVDGSIMALVLVNNGTINYPVVFNDIPAGTADIPGFLTTYPGYPGISLQSDALSRFQSSLYITRMADLDCTVTGTRQIGYINGLSRYFIPALYSLLLTQANTITTAPTVSFGVVSPNYTDILAATVLSTLGLTNLGDVFNHVMASTHLFANDVPVFANVTVAAVATAYHIRFELIGDNLLR